MNAAGIFRHIAADRAGDLTRWIRRVIEAMCLHRACDSRICDSRLNHDTPIFVINFDDAVHARASKKNAVGERQSATGQRGARAARDDPQALTGRIFQHRTDLCGRHRQDANQRELTIGGQRIPVIGAQ